MDSLDKNNERSGEVLEDWHTSGTSVELIFYLKGYSLDSWHILSWLKKVRMEFQIKSSAILVAVQVEIVISVMLKML